MAGTFKTRIITQEKVLHEGEAESLVAPASTGQLGILRNHAPLMTTLGIGVLKVGFKDKSKNLYFAIYGGFLQVKDNQVIVLAEKAAAGAEMDPAEAEKELERLKSADTEPGESAPVDPQSRALAIEMARASYKAALLSKEIFR